MFIFCADATINKHTKVYVSTDSQKGATCGPFTRASLPVWLLFSASLNNFSIDMQWCSCRQVLNAVLSIYRYCKHCNVVFVLTFIIWEQAYNYSDFHSHKCFYLCCCIRSICENSFIMFWRYIPQLLRDCTILTSRWTKEHRLTEFLVVH